MPPACRRPNPTGQPVVPTALGPARDSAPGADVAAGAARTQRLGLGPAPRLGPPALPAHGSRGSPRRAAVRPSVRGTRSERPRREALAALGSRRCRGRGDRGVRAAPGLARPRALLRCPPPRAHLTSRTGGRGRARRHSARPFELAEGGNGGDSRRAAAGRGAGGSGTDAPSELRRPAGSGGGGTGRLGGTGKEERNRPLQVPSARPAASAPPGGKAAFPCPIVTLLFIRSRFLPRPEAPDGVRSELG